MAWGDRKKYTLSEKISYYTGKVGALANKANRTAKEEKQLQIGRGFLAINNPVLKDNKAFLRGAKRGLNAIFGKKDGKNKNGKNKRREFNSYETPLPEKTAGVGNKYNEK